MLKLHDKLCNIKSKTKSLYSWINHLEWSLRQKWERINGNDYQYTALQHIPNWRRFMKQMWRLAFCHSGEHHDLHSQPLGGALLTCFCFLSSWALWSSLPGFTWQVLMPFLSWWHAYIAIELILGEQMRWRIPWRICLVFTL